MFTQASRAALINVNDYLDYDCNLGANNVCFGPLQVTFPCDSMHPIDGFCKVSGRMVLYTLQGTSLDESKWVPFGYLVLIFARYDSVCVFLY